MQIRPAFFTQTNNTSFSALHLKNGANHWQMFPDNVYVDVIRNKEIQKLAAEYALCGEDITIRYEKAPTKDQTLHIFADTETNRYQKHIVSISYDYLDKFNADKYIEKPRATKFLEEFNKSIEKFSHKVNSTVDKIIDEFGK